MAEGRGGSYQKVKKLSPLIGVMIKFKVYETHFLVGLRYPGKCVDNIWPVCPWFKSAMDSKMVRIRNGFEPGTGVIIFC